MRGKRIRYIVCMTVAMLLLAAGIVFTISISASASNPVNMNVDKFRLLSGESGYLNYADNYQLDMEDAGLLDQLKAFANWLANVLFGIVRGLGKVVVTLYYYCMEFDLSALFADDIDKVQAALNSGVFKPLFYLAFCGSAVHMIKTFIKRDMIGSFIQVAKVIGILIMSLLVVNYSSTVISYATGITKGFSTAILLSVNGNEDTTDTASYAAQTAGILWTNLVHQPWIYAEFGGEPATEEIIGQLLCIGDENQIYQAGSKEREKLIKKYPGTAFDKERAGGKFIFMLLYLFPFLGKSGVYLILAVLSLAFQLFGIFYVLMAPVVLLMIMVPGYEALLSAWLKKLLETQLGILMMSLLTGLLVLMDNLLFEKCAAWGWGIVFAVQTLVLLIVIFKRNEILGALGKLQKASANAGYARALMQNSNSNIAMSSGNALRTTAEKVYSGATMVGEKGKAVGMWALTKGYQVANKVEHDRTTKALDAIASAAGNYEVDYAALTEKKVERPVLDPQKVINVQTVDGHLERADAPNGRQMAGGIGRNASVTAEQPQEAPIRPRMDNCQIVRTETVNGHLTRPDAAQASAAQQPVPMKRTAMLYRARSENPVSNSTPEGIQPPTQWTVPSSAPNVIRQGEMQDDASEPQRPKLYAAVAGNEPDTEQLQSSQPKTSISRLEPVPVAEAPQTIAPVQQARPSQTVETQFAQPPSAMLRRQPTAEQHQGTVPAQRLQEAGQMPTYSDAGTKAPNAEAKRQASKSKRVSGRQHIPNETAGMGVVEAHAAERAGKVSRPRSAARKKAGQYEE